MRYTICAIAAMEQLEQAPSFKEQAFRRIKAGILTGALRPGARLREREVAARFGISRTPIREALLHLANEGLVVFSARRGAMVSHRSVDDSAELYSLRGVLVGGAARRAAARMTAADLQRLAQLTEQLGEAARRGDSRKFFEINQHAHETFLARCGSRRLVQICGKLREQLQEYPIRMSSMPGWMAQSTKEHRAMLRAFRRRDPGIEGMIRRHWRFKLPRERIVEILEAKESIAEVGGKR
jgi:DNA-binding GntR family transcriptional regulator